MNRWATGQTPAPLWAGEYLGALIDLAALHAKYLAPGKDAAPQRLAHLLDVETPRSPGANQPGQD